jgi:hypothetical protein
MIKQGPEDGKLENQAGDGRSDLNDNIVNLKSYGKGTDNVVSTSPML